MPSHSFIPERQLVFSPELAQTIGLEEAILLQHLQQISEHQYSSEQQGAQHVRAGRDYLTQTLPFWTVEDLHRIARSLADKGIISIESPPLLGSSELVFGLTIQATGQGETTSQFESHAHGKSGAVDASGLAAASARTHTGTDLQPHRHTPDQPQTTARAQLTQRRSAGLLPVHWSPSEDLLQLLSLNHNIPRQFALDQLEDFIFYWRERGEISHAWENKFRQHVTSSWRRQQQQEAEAFLQQPPAPLDQHWQPSADAMDIMLRASIAREFIEQAIPEFILYWRERGTAPKELNSKFIQHVRLQWAKYNSSLSHSTEPTRISQDWAPAADVYDILRLSHIDAEFARSLLPEFIVYWRDSNQVQTSWNSKFLQHVKYHWAKRHSIERTDTTHAGYKGTGGANRPSGRTRDRSLEDDLTDTSWAK